MFQSPLGGAGTEESLRITVGNDRYTDPRRQSPRKSYETESERYMKRGLQSTEPHDYQHHTSDNFERSPYNRTSASYGQEDNLYNYPASDYKSQPSTQQGIDDIYASHSTERRDFSKKSSSLVPGLTSTMDIEDEDEFLYGDQDGRTTAGPSSSEGRSYEPQAQRKRENDRHTLSEMPSYAEPERKNFINQYGDQDYRQSSSSSQLEYDQYGQYHTNPPHENKQTFRDEHYPLQSDDRYRRENDSKGMKHAGLSSDHNVYKSQHSPERIDETWRRNQSESYSTAPQQEKKDVDPTIQNILKSIGFNFELSKIMQEKAEKERGKQQRRENDDFTTNRRESFNDGSLKDVYTDRQKEEVYQQKESEEFRRSSQRRSAALLGTAETYEEMAKRYREEQARHYNEERPQHSRDTDEYRDNLALHYNPPRPESSHTDPYSASGYRTEKQETFDYGHGHSQGQKEQQQKELNYRDYDERYSDRYSSEAKYDVHGTASSHKPDVFPDTYKARSTATPDYKQDSREIKSGDGDRKYYSNDSESDSVRRSSSRSRDQYHQQDITRREHDKDDRPKNTDSKQDKYYESDQKRKRQSRSQEKGRADDSHYKSSRDTKRSKHSPSPVRERRRRSSSPPWEKYKRSVSPPREKYKRSVSPTRERSKQSLSPRREKYKRSVSPQRERQKTTRYPVSPVYNTTSRDKSKSSVSPPREKPVRSASPQKEKIKKSSSPPKALAKDDLRNVLRSSERSSKRIVLPPKSDRDKDKKKESLETKAEDKAEKRVVSVLTSKEQEQLQREKEERQKRLVLLERELDKLRRQQGEMMRKKQKQRDGHKDPLLVENSKLQDEISKQISALRKNVENQTKEDKTPKNIKAIKFKMEKKSKVEKVRYCNLNLPFLFYLSMRQFEVICILRKAILFQILGGWQMISTNQVGCGNFATLGRWGGDFRMG